MTVVVSKNHNWDEIKAKAKMEIDRKAEIERAKLVTPILGQDYVYQEKYREALAYFAPDADQDPDLFPLLNSEAMALGTTIANAANQIVANQRALNQRLAEIEVIRRQGKLAIDACENRIASIQAVVAATVFA